MLGQSWADLAPEELSIVEEIYNNNPETAIHARTILSLVKGIQFERYPFDVSTSHAPQIVKPKDETINTDRLKIYPNPSSDYTTVEISLSPEHPFGHLKIYNTLGILVKNLAVANNDVVTIYALEFNNGIYLFVLEAEQTIVSRNKVIISR